MFWQTRNYNTSENDCQQQKSSCPVVVVKMKKEIGFLILTSLRGYQHSFSAEASYLLSNKTTIYAGRSTLVGQRPMKSLSPVCLSICPSPSFLKIGLLVFDDYWPWYLVTGKARFLKTKFGGPNLVPMGLNQTKMSFFCHFIEFGSYDFSDSLKR